MPKAQTAKIYDVMHLLRDYLRHDEEAAIAAVNASQAIAAMDAAPDESVQEASQSWMGYAATTAGFFFSRGVALAKAGIDHVDKRMIHDERLTKARQSLAETALKQIEAATTEEEKIKHIQVLIAENMKLSQTHLGTLHSGRLHIGLLEAMVLTQSEANRLCASVLASPALNASAATAACASSM